MMEYLNQFSTKEKEVIALLLQGKSNKQIALSLGITNRTVEYHMGNIFVKLGSDPGQKQFWQLQVTITVHPMI